MMEKAVLFIALLLSFGIQSYGQIPQDSATFSPVVRLGTSLTYIWDRDPHYLREYTWALNMGVMPTKRINIGVNVMNIWSETRTEPRGRHLMAGVFGQYHFGLRTDKATIFLETGGYWGNYCTCGPGDPYRKDGLFLIPAGGGLNARLTKDLWLDAGFMVYNIINDVPRKYSFTQYVIGLDWVLGK